MKRDYWNRVTIKTHNKKISHTFSNIRKITIVFSANFQNNSTAAKGVIAERYFERFYFKVIFGGSISYTLQQLPVVVFPWVDGIDFKSDTIVFWGWISPPRQAPKLTKVMCPYMYPHPHMVVFSSKYPKYPLNNGLVLLIIYVDFTVYTFKHVTVIVKKWMQTI